MKYPSEEKQAVGKSYGVMPGFVVKCVGIVALTMAMVLLVSCGNNTASTDESVTTGINEDAKEENSTFDIFEGFERDEDGNIVLPDLPIRP